MKAKNQYPVLALPRFAGARSRERKSILGLFGRTFGFPRFPAGNIRGTKGQNVSSESGGRGMGGFSFGPPFLREFASLCPKGSKWDSSGRTIARHLIPLATIRFCAQPKRAVLRVASGPRPKISRQSGLGILSDERKENTGSELDSR